MSKYILSLWSLLMVVAISVIVVSCGDDDEPESTETLLLSFGPTGIQHGEMMVIIGENLSKVSAVVFATDVSVPAASFASQDDDRIELVVPDQAEKGKIKLITDIGEIESKTEINFEVVFGITNMPAEARPGSNITITGQFLNWIESITFFKDLVVEDFVSQSANEIVVTVPVDAKTGPLEFYGTGTEPIAIVTEAELIVSLPSVTDFSTSSLKHAEDLTLTGTNLDLTTAIVFPDGSEVSDFIEISESTIVVEVPTTAVDGPLTLVVASGESVTTDQTISIVLPEATELSPSPVEIGGELTIIGTNLDLVRSVAFPGLAFEIENFESQSADEIKVIVPEGTLPGFMKFTTIHDFVVNFSIELKLPGDGPTPLLYSIFDDNFENGWQNWSWGGAVEAPSSELVFDGAGSLKKSYDGSWDAMYFGGSSVDVSSYTNMVVYLYGGAGTSGQNVQMVLNEQWGAPVGVMPIVEGEWTEYSFPLSDLISGSGAGTQWNHIVFQGQGATGDVFYDFVGFR